MCVNNKTVLFYTAFFSVLLNIYISNIYNIYNPDKKMSLASQTICYHIFSDPKLGYTFHIFGYVPRLYFSSSRMWKFSTYFKSRKVSKSTVSWFLIESNLIQPEYYFLTNTEKNWNTTWRSIQKIAQINQATRLTLFIFFGWNFIQIL